MPKSSTAAVSVIATTSSPNSSPTKRPCSRGHRSPSIFLFSNYVWTLERNLALSALAKQLNPASITIHGGPSTPKYEQDAEIFFAEYAHVDVTVRNEGEATFAELLDALDPSDPEHLDVLRDVRGLTFRSSAGSPVRTEERERIADLDTIPSPVSARAARPVRRGASRRRHRDQPRLPIRLHVLRLGIGDTLEDPQVLSRSCLRRARVECAQHDRHRVDRGRQLRHLRARRRDRGEDRRAQAHVRLSADRRGQLREEHGEAPSKDHRDLR